MADIFPSRQEIKERLKNNTLDNSNINYREDLLSKLQVAVSSTDEWKDEPNKIIQVEKQKVFFWIRIYLNEEDSKLKTGDEICMTYTPTNEKINLIFGAYEKEGLSRDHDDEVINYVTTDDKKILCCMVDTERVNKDSEDIPTLRTFFRNSKYYTENLFLKTDLTITFDDTQYEYYSISF